MFVTVFLGQPSEMSPASDNSPTAIQPMRPYTPESSWGSLCPTGLLALWTGGSKESEAQGSVHDDHTGESQKSTLLEPWARLCLTSFAPLRRAPRSVRSSGWGNILCSARTLLGWHVNTEPVTAWVFYNVVMRT